VNRDKFDVSDLVKIPQPQRPVVLKSGGIPASLMCVEGQNAMVEWLAEWTESGKPERAVVPVVCLYACVPLGEHLAANPLPEPTIEG
jgi:hypothetical protein